MSPDDRGWFDQLVVALARQPDDPGVEPAPDIASEYRALALAVALWISVIVIALFLVAR